MKQLARTLALIAGLAAMAAPLPAMAGKPRPTPTPTPSPSRTPTPTPTPTPDEKLWGFADLHAHPASHLSFGADSGGHNGLVYGSPGEEALNALTITKLKPCDADKHTSSGDIVEDGTQVMAFTSLDGSTGANHGVGGYPFFRGWPAARSVTHQQMHLEWLKRAHAGGLRLMVASVTDNKLLSALWANSGFLLTEQDINQINDYDSAVKQLEFIVKVAKLNETWMEVAKNAAQAEKIIKAGKLALVLGVEMDDLTADQLIALKKKYGVTVVNPIHLADNEAFGGSGVYSNLFNTLNRTMWGEHYQARFDPSIGFRLSAPLKVGVDVKFAPLLPMLFADYVSPSDDPDSLCGPDNEYDYCHPNNTLTLDGHANARGLNETGTSGVMKLWKNAMIVDLAHMSDLSQRDTLMLASRMTSGQMPVIDSHTDLRAEIGTAPAHTITERKLLPEHAQAIAAAGGMIGLGTEGDIGARPLSREQSTPMVRMSPDETFVYHLDNPRLILALGTGGDNLDDKSKVRATATINGDEHVFGWLKQPTNDSIEQHEIEELEELANESVHWITLKLPPGTRATDVQKLKLELVQDDPTCMGECDNWKLRRFEVYFVGRDEAARLYSATSPDFLHYFKAYADHPPLETPDWTVPLAPDGRQVVLVETVTGNDPVSDDKGWINFYFSGPAVLTPYDLFGHRISPSRGTFKGLYVERPFALPEGKTAHDITEIKFGTLDQDCETFCDNWDVNSIRVTSPNPTGNRVLFQRSSGPAFRFTGTDETINALVRLEIEPPVVPTVWNTDAPPPPKVEFVQIGIQTDTDDLRLGNELVGELIIDGVPMDPFSLNDGAKWFDGTSHLIIKQLPQPVPAAAIRALKIRYTSSHDDRYKIASIQIDALGKPVHGWYDQYQKALTLMGGKGIAIGTDLNGLNPLMPFSEVAVGYPLAPPAPASYTGLPAVQKTGERTFRFQEEGISQVGQLPEFLQAVQNVGGSPASVEPIFRSAHDFVQMWKKVESVAATMP